MYYKTMSKELSESEEIEDLMLTKKEKKALRKKDKEIKKEVEEPENLQYKKLREKSERAQKIIKLSKSRDEEESDMSESQKQVTLFQTPNTQLSTQQNSIPDLVAPKTSSEAGRVIQNQVARPPMDDSGDVDLNKLFSSEVGNDSDVVKELFSQENIKVKTDLSEKEVSIISRLELQASMTQNFFLTKVLKELEILRVSKDRKSRGEFVSSFSGIKEQNSGATAFGKLGNIFKNDKV